MHSVSGQRTFEFIYFFHAKSSCFVAFCSNKLHLYKKKKENTQMMKLSFEESSQRNLVMDR